MFSEANLGAAAVPPTPARTSAGVAQVVQESCERLFLREEEFVERAEQALSDLLPQVRQLAPTEARTLSATLVRCVLWAALAHDPAPLIVATIQEVGANSHRQGFPDEGYLTMGHALLRAARAVYRGEWDSRLSAEWVSYLTWLIGNLQQGAAAARAAADGNG